MENPLVSVVIATFRRRESLSKAIQSVIDQTYKNIELIIVDDNNDLEWNDYVKSTVDSFHSSDISIKLITNEKNLGSAKTRNTGITAASGKYLTFLDDDDYYLPERIENQVIPMDKDSIDFSITDLALYNERDSLIEIRKREYLLGKEKENLRLCHLRYHMTGTDTMMFKTSYLRKIGCFEPIDVGDEFYLMEKAIDNNGTFLYVPVCDVNAYVHSMTNGLSSGLSKIQGENALFEYKKKYFEGLNGKDRRYISMRHHLVLAFAYLRMHNLVLTFIETVKSFIYSPFGFFKILFSAK